MSGEVRKLLIWLSGLTGFAVVVVLTTLALKLILKPSAATTEVQAPAVATTTTPAQTPAVATVIAVKGHYVTETIPSRHCHEVQHTVYVSQESSAPGAGAVVGGVAGGLLGSTVGGGNGRIVTSAAGAILGAVTGASVQNSMNAPTPYAAYSTACKTHYIKTSVQKGYEVTYTYNGSQGVIIMTNPPLVGSVLPVPMN